MSEYRRIKKAKFKTSKSRDIGRLPVGAEVIETHFEGGGGRLYVFYLEPKKPGGGE